MDRNKISIDDFLIIANVKLSTVRKNKEKIPGLKLINGNYDILKGTRYPADFHRYKIKNSEDRRFLLLKAISEFKYVDNFTLHLYQEQFVGLIRDLLTAELIRENHLFNRYGANAYDCTPKGDDLIKSRKTIAVQEITNLVASAAGNFVGTVISQQID